MPHTSMTASLVPSRLVKIAATSSAAINVSLNATDFSSKSPGFILASAEKNVINSEPEALSSREVHLHITLDLPSTEHLPNLQQRKSQQLKQKQPSLNQLETINAVSQNRLVNQQPIPERPRRRRRQDSPRPQLKLNHLPRPQHRRQGVPVPKTKGFPQDTDRCNHITNAPGYVTPFKRYRDWSTGNTFEYLGTISAGGFGCAVKVKTKEKFLALKVCANSEERKSSYEREVKMLTLLKNNRHPNIVTFGSAFQDRDQLCLSLELASMDLEKKLRSNNRLDMSLTKYIATGIARGLSHLHKNFIVHRDIKPDNILLTGCLARHPVITDFGLSVSLKDNPYGAWGECGTKGYRAPEIREMNHYSYPVDVYAFGVTIHRMAGGRFPEHGGLTRLSNLEVKELVDRMMHDVIDMRMKIDDVLKHSLFRMSVSEQEVAISGNKHLLDDTIENEMGTKRARRRRTYKAYERERISFSERQPGHGQSLQIINVATTVDLHHAPTLP